MKATPIHDVFRPRHEPAQSIYDAFQDEAKKRNTRHFEVSTAAEVDAVLERATALAPKHHLNTPTREQVLQAEIYARGSIDYGATWVYALLRRMQPDSTNP